MFRSRTRCRLASIVAIAALVLAQALVVAHACILAAPTDAAAEACHHGAQEQPAPATLCKAHCEAGTQTLDQTKPLVAPDLGAPLRVLRADDFAPAVTTAGATRWLAQPGVPPPFLLHRRLRI